MAGKSQHSRRRNVSGGKKKKVRRDPVVAVERQEAVLPASKEVPVTAAPARPTKAALQTQALARARYAYVPGELRRIGILAGIMLIILVVLAKVLP